MSKRYCYDQDPPFRKQFRMHGAAERQPVLRTAGVFRLLGRKDDPSKKHECILSV